MKVLLSSDENPTYLQFLPLVSAAWRRIGIEPYLALVTDKPRSAWQHLEQYAEIRQLNTCPDFPAPNWAKVARWNIYPDIGDERGIVSCIDMVPLNRDYFRCLGCYSRDKLVLASFDAYREWGDQRKYRKFPGCYMVATGHVWREIIERYPKLSFDDWESMSNPPDHFSEESKMRQHVYDWDPDGERTVKLSRPGGWHWLRRVDRNMQWYYNKILMDQGYYLDAHCLRPLEDHIPAMETFVRDAGFDPGLIRQGIAEAQLGD